MAKTHTFHAHFWLIFLAPMQESAFVLLVDGTTDVTTNGHKGKRQKAISLFSPLITSGQRILHGDRLKPQTTWQKFTSQVPCCIPDAAENIHFYSSICRLVSMENLM